MEVMPIATGALGTVRERLNNCIEKIDLQLGVQILQTLCLLGSGRIVRKVLDCK